MSTHALIRVSTDEQTTRSQRDEIARWATARGAEVTWHEERGVSGAARQRPVLDALMADARRGRVSTLVVAELSRLGRSLARVATAIDELTACGVAVVSIREGIDTSTPMGRAMAGMATVFAELERERIRDRVRAGIASAQSRGVRVGRPRLEWRDQELRQLAEMRAAGMSPARIAASGELVLFDTQGKPRRPSARSIYAAMEAHRGRLEALGAAG